MKIPVIKAAKGFAYSDAPQGSPEWVQNRLGKLTASRLGDWLAVSKNGGKPLKAREDYERELAYEKQFGSPFERYVTSAMQLGIDYEAYVVEQYQLATGNETAKCGAFYNDLFVASPDRLIGDDGVLEVKVLGDVAFADLLTNGVPEKYYLQVQGQLLASGRKYADFVAANLQAQKIKVVRIEPDAETLKRISDSLVKIEDTALFDTTNVYDFSSAVEQPAQATEEVWN